MNGLGRFFSEVLNLFGEETNIKKEQNTEMQKS